MGGQQGGFGGQGQGMSGQGMEVREVPCSREECREVEWVLVDLRSVYSFGLHCLLDTQPFEQAVVS